MSNVIYLEYCEITGIPLNPTKKPVMEFWVINDDDQVCATCPTLAKAERFAIDNKITGYIDAVML